VESNNVYEDKICAESYAALEFPNTYYLAYRDIPDILQKHLKGKKAIDFGCGTGRSTRFLKRYGYETIGIDISEEMIKRAKKFDPAGVYYQINDNDFSQLKNNHFDLMLSMFTFDNIPNIETRIKILKSLNDLINEEGRIVMLDAAPENYFYEWASFSTKDFPENKNAKSGEKVKIIITDVEDKRPVEDNIWFHNDYLDLFDKAGLTLIEFHKPLGKSEEPYNWINETVISPWVIYVLGK
jgi:SAM-dependent methyltransferase